MAEPIIGEAGNLHKIKHGNAFFGRRTIEYSTWTNLKQRCFDPRSTSFAHYGGRGITVCAAWRNSFATFLADMGPRPTPDHSIDRIDCNGDYEPRNCRWATPTQQACNTRSNRMVTFRGETLTVAEWARQVDMKYFTLLRRLRAGWTAERALLTPVLRVGVGHK